MGPGDAGGPPRGTIDARASMARKWVMTSAVPYIRRAVPGLPRLASCAAIYNPCRWSSLTFDNLTATTIVVSICVSKVPLSPQSSIILPPLAERKFSSHYSIRKAVFLFMESTEVIVFKCHEWMANF